MILLKAWFWHTQIKSILTIIFCFIVSLFAIVTFIGEITLFLQDKNTSSIFSLIVSQADGQYYQTQFLCLIPLIFMFFFVYYSLFEINIEGFYGLYPHKNTDGLSLNFFGKMSARVSAPLVYNFLEIMKEKGTMFGKVMGPYKFTPFTQFMTYFPMLLIPLLILNYGNIWQKIMVKAGVSKFSFNDHNNEEKIERGKQLLKKGKFVICISLIVEKARRIRERKFLSINDQALFSKHGYSVQMNLINSQSEAFPEENQSGYGISQYEPVQLEEKTLIQLQTRHSDDAPDF